jgi:HEAT repeat protein
LSYALLSDADESVRREAALALGAYAGTDADPPALRYAMNNDASADVRLAARVATMTYDEQQAFVRETLLDASLTPAERLAPRTMIMRGSTMPAALFTPMSNDQQEEARAFADIVAGTDDMDLRLRGLSELSRMTMFSFSFPDPDRLGPNSLDPAIIDVLIDNARVSDQRVRRMALQGLTRNVGNEAVRALLETIIEDEPEFANEARIEEAIAQYERLKRQQEELDLQRGR